MEIGEESTILDMESTIVELFNLFLYKFGIGNRGFWLLNSGVVSELSAHQVLQVSNYSKIF